MSQEQGDPEARTVRLDLDGLYKEAVELVGQQEADRLWAEHRLDVEEKWAGKWAKAWEIVQNLREAAADQ
jgi:hypothetical protein